MLNKGLLIADALLKLGEGAGLPLLPAVCGAAREVLSIVQQSTTLIADSLSVAKRVIEVLELLQCMAENVKRFTEANRAGVEGRMSKLKELLVEVRTIVAKIGKKGWLKRAFTVAKDRKLSEIDADITKQLDTLLSFYNLARDAHFIDERLRPRDYAVEAEVERHVHQRKLMGEDIGTDALMADLAVLRDVAVESGVSDAEFQEEMGDFRVEVREGFGAHGLKLDAIQMLVEQLKVSGSMAAAQARSDLRYSYEARPEAPPGQKVMTAARLGRGTFGDTFRMRKKDGIDGRLYAVKFVEDRNSELSESQLTKEAKLLSQLDHPHAVRYYDAFWYEKKARDDEDEDKKQLVIVMELLEGGQLGAKITMPPQPQSKTAEWVRQVALALAYIHSLNIQHRDLKPENVMLDLKGRAKIIDFGLACTSSASRSRSNKTAVGTDAYMSPEKANGKPYGAADDVWAVGCILAELLLGRNIGNVALDVKKLRRSISESKEASAPLGSWVEGCLQPNSRMRPPAAELEQGLASTSEKATYVVRTYYYVCRYLLLLTDVLIPFQERLAPAATEA